MPWVDLECQLIRARMKLIRGALGSTTPAKCRVTSPIQDFLERLQKEERPTKTRV